MPLYEISPLFQELTEQAKDLHQRERRITLESLRLIGEIESRKVYYYLDMSIEKYTVHIGLSPSKYFKRLKAWRVVSQYAKARKMFEDGHTEISHLAMCAGRITHANADLILNGIRGKSKREVEAFLSRVTNDGQLLDREGFTEISFRISDSENELFERAREVLAHGGHVPSNNEVMMQALKDMLEKRDPMKKAERSVARKEKAKAVPETVEEAHIIPMPSPTIEQSATQTRTAVPGAVRNAVWLRDGGQCTHLHADGERCPARMMLEMDHIHMVCRGGKNEVDNIRLRCRMHNRYAAEEALGKEFIEKFYG